MRWIPGAIIAGVLLAATMMSAQKTIAPENLLQSGIEKETVDGDLKAAIEIYRKVARSEDRAVAVKALIHIADCYQKLGDAQARATLQQIVREFSDQKEEAAIARARLGQSVAAARPMSVKGDRAVWTGPSVGFYGSASADGRFISGRLDKTGNLVIHDVAKNENRALTPPVNGWYRQFASSSRISRDGKQVVYVWWTNNEEGTQQRSGFRSRSLESGLLEPRQLFPMTDDLVIQTFDLSTDNKWIAADIWKDGVKKDDRYEIVLIAVADGRLRVLKTNDAASNIFFSPDSKYIAYDLPASDPKQQRDIFVLPIEGSSDNYAVAHNATSVMGWSPDGTLLLFSSDRTGSVGLWAVPVAAGKAQGSPQLLKSDIGSSLSLGLTTSGALYVLKRISTIDVATAPIDLTAGKLTGPPVKFTQGFIDGVNTPRWSPDGKYLAYHVKCNNGCIAIRSVATGQVRRLGSANLTTAGLVFWSPDGRSLLTRGRDLRGRSGVFRIDVESGDAAVVTLDDMTMETQWSPDGRKAYFHSNTRGVFVEHDLASGAERDIYRGESGVVYGRLSPDGRYLAVEKTLWAPNILTLVPVAGGEPRELIRLPEGEKLTVPVVWTPDNKAVLITKEIASSLELWLVPITGDPPRKLDIDPQIWMVAGQIANDRHFSLSPDGRNIAFTIGDATFEVWALENFLPPSKTSTRGTR